MTEPEFNAGVASGSITATDAAPTDTGGGAAAPETQSIPLTQFVPLLMQLQSVQLCVSTAPTAIPQTFQEQIVFVFDGSNYFLYLYFNNQWNSFPVIGGGGSGVTQALAGFGIAISPGGGTGIVTIGSTIDDATLPMSDITTNNVSISQHGFVPKLPNDATKFLNGVGAFATPSGGGGVGSSTFLVGSGAGDYSTTSTTLADIDATNLKATISGLTVGSILSIRTWFKELNSSNSGALPLMQLNDLTNSATIFTYFNAYGGTGYRLYYAEALYTAPSTSLQISLQWNCGGNGLQSLINNSASIGGTFLQAFNTSGDVVSASTGNFQSVVIWVQQMT
jgi:hypothetical protein